jgi:hypothetical protein
VQLEHDDRAARVGVVAGELGADDAWGVKAQPVAIEAKRPIQAGHGEPDDIDAGIHG